MDTLQPNPHTLWTPRPPTPRCRSALKSKPHLLLPTPAPFPRARGLQLNVQKGDFFVDGPLFLKSGVSFSGTWSDDSPNYTKFKLYPGENNGNTTEDAIFVVDGGRGGVVSSTVRA